MSKTPVISQTSKVVVVPRFFCVFCLSKSTDKQKLTFDVKYEFENHLRGKHFNDSPPEEELAINLFIERHGRYLEQLHKCMSQPIKTIPDRNKTVYRGCPMCDAIIEVFDIKDEPKGAEKHELLIRDLNVDYSGNNVNHINPHLRYYPYECIICHEEVQKARNRGETDKEVVKTAVKAMMRRHIIDKHLKNTDLIKDALEKACENATKVLKVEYLDKLTRKQPDLNSSGSQGKTGMVHKKIKHSSQPGPLRKAASPTSVISPLDVKPKVPQTFIVLPKPSSSPSVPGAKQPIPGQILPTISTPYKIITSAQPTPTKYIMVRTIPDPKKAMLTSVLRPMPITSTLPVMTAFKKIEPKQEPQSDTSMDTTCDAQTSSKDESTIEEIEISDSEESDSETITSEEEVTDKEMKSMRDKSGVFGCVFCHKRYKTYEKALDHYLLHTKEFIECAKCDKLFTSIGDFRIHDPSHNEMSNLKNLNQYKIARKWAENFLCYVTKEKDKFADLCRSGLELFCPVCVFANTVYDMTSDKKMVDPETIKIHLHNHFNYLPYECIDCAYDDLKTEFFLDQNARKHLTDKHSVQKVENLTEKEFNSYFDKKNSIKKLDEVIEESIKVFDSYQYYHKMNSEFISMYLK